jgi:DNA-binding CsgD family transcriptional regulator
MLEDPNNRDRMYGSTQPSCATLSWLNGESPLADEADVVDEQIKLKLDFEGFGGDPRLEELLTLAGALDIARGGWLCRVDQDGLLDSVMATVGIAPPIEITHVLQSFKGLINLSNADQPFQWLSAGREYLVCDIGHDGVGRIILVLRSRMFRAADWATIKVAARRLQRLVQLGMALGTPAEQTCRVEAPAEIAPQALCDLCPFGVLVIDFEQRIHLANHAVKELFERSGLIVCAGDKLAISDSENAVRFQVALRSVLTAEPRQAMQQTVALLDEKSEPMLLTIAALPGADDERKACVVITNPAAGCEADIQPLAQVLGLSPVEARLVKELVRGRNVQEAAQELHLKIETARTYLKQVFQKTNTHRQLELVQLMQNGALPTV